MLVTLVWWVKWVMIDMFQLKEREMKKQNLTHSLMMITHLYVDQSKMLFCQKNTNSCLSENSTRPETAGEIIVMVIPFLL